MFVQFHLDSDVLTTALEHAPGTQVAVQHLDSSSSVPLRSVFWASEGNFEAFETGLGVDETITDWRLVAENGDERLYRVHYAPDQPDVDIYNAAIDADGVFLKGETDGDGWTVKMLYPSRDAFNVFREACAAVDLNVDVDSIYSKPFSGSGDDIALTDPQRDLLTRAVQVGYFDIPRETTLQELGQQMNISGQAASERLRRGMETLIRETVTEEALAEEENNNT
ncbi:helix-turn-helix domain-containing protein [Halorubellus sp. PRR65]|uniref:helix-turn-helix domain-containing protein n=1 Tax=Halorubellus sp. PRR65 TaxID=3098148 RepID=UPI002B262B29|nr:helix-turn-helix domain-containing protein [Halorubellus sp. PRR65]